MGPKLVTENITDKDKAYFAGLLDGEGTILLSHHPGKPLPYLYVGITNTYFPVLFEGITKWGGSLRHDPTPSCQTWMLYANMASKFLKDVLPFLRIKKQEAMWAIAYQDTKRTTCNRIQDNKHDLLKLRLAEKVREAFLERKEIESLPFEDSKEKLKQFKERRA